MKNLVSLHFAMFCLHFLLLYDFISPANMYCMQRRVGKASKKVL